MTDEHVYGVRARVNGGLGLWQMAYASKAPLTAVNYAAAREYRYISPSFYLHKKTERVVAIKGAGLVHVPALNLVALARPGDDQNGDDTETSRRGLRRRRGWTPPRTRQKSLRPSRPQRRPTRPGSFPSTLCATCRRPPQR